MNSKDQAGSHAEIVGTYGDRVVTGLYRRISWAISGWLEARRDVALLRQFLDAKGDGELWRKTISPTRVLLGFLEKFAALDHEAVKLKFDGASIQFDPPMFPRIPLNFPGRWDEVLAEVTPAPRDIGGFREQELRMQRAGQVKIIFIQRRYMTEEMLDSLRKDPGLDLGFDSLMTFSKSSLTEKPI